MLEHEADMALAGAVRRAHPRRRTETSPAVGQSSPAMIRSSVVLPEPDGPSSATNSPVATFRSTPSSAMNVPNFLHDILDFNATRGYSPLVQTPLEDGFHHQRDQRQHRQQRGDRERRHELIFVVEHFHMQRHGVGLAADMPRDHRHRAEFAHRACVAQQHAIQHAPFDVRQGDAEESLQAGRAQRDRGLFLLGALLLHQRESARARQTGTSRRWSRARCPAPRTAHGCHGPAAMVPNSPGHRTAARRPGRRSPG